MNLRRHAARNAQDAIARARERAQAFDYQTALDRKANEGLVDGGDDEKVEVDGEESVMAGPATAAPIMDCE